MAISTNHLFRLNWKLTSGGSGLIGTVADWVVVCKNSSLHVSVGLLLDLSFSGVEIVEDMTFYFYEESLLCVGQNLKSII